MNKKEKGFSLIEVMISLGIMAVVAKGGMSLITYINKVKKEQTVKSTVEVSNLLQQKSITKNTFGLDAHDFYNELFYKKKADNSSFVRVSEVVTDLGLLDYSAQLMTSNTHIAGLKSQSEFKRVYLSYCTQKDDYDATPDWDELRKKRIVPVLGLGSQKNQIFCCDKDLASRCYDDKNNILKPEISPYYVRTAVVVFSNGSVKGISYLPRKGEENFITSQGFSITNSKDGSMLESTQFSIYNDCARKRVLDIQFDFKKCQNRNYFNFKHSSNEFNRSVSSGASDLGDLGI